MTNPAPTLSFVIPCYNEEEALPALLEALTTLSARLVKSGRIAAPAEPMLVDDGSRDNTWKMIEAARKTHGVTGLRLSRNQGHQAALLAGLLNSDADVTISMDADLQDDPTVVEQMLDRYREGAEIVFGVRAARDTDTAFKRITARGYYKMLTAMGVDIIPDHADFRLMSAKTIRALDSFKERNLFLRGLVRQIGFESAIVTYDRAERVAGDSKYPLRKMLSLAVEGVTSFSIKPLRIITGLGFIVAGLSMCYAIYSLVMWTMGSVVPGWTSIVLPIYILGGVHMIALGVIGEYIGKIYLETKGRPRFIVDEITRPNQAASEAPVRIAAE
ncbi:MAG: glycosyltransferase family 2 protein [Rhodobacteraceae bacterium]|nr:glycosyltransferase family 2 protein [Paracoccaceae bacterium]